MLLVVEFPYIGSHSLQMTFSVFVYPFNRAPHIRLLDLMNGDAYPLKSFLRTVLTLKIACNAFLHAPRRLDLDRGRRHGGARRDYYLRLARCDLNRRVCFICGLLLILVLYYILDGFSCSSDYLTLVMSVRNEGFYCT